MPIDFFEKEVLRAREKFNQTFGMLTVCDLRLRQSTILAIGFLGKLGNRIMEANNKDEVKAEIQKFMKTKKILSNLFVKIEEHQKERRNNVNTNRAKSHSDGRSTVQGESRNLRKLRQHF
jgi:hypothetical protein